MTCLKLEMAALETRRWWGNFVAATSHPPSHPPTIICGSGAVADLLDINLIDGALVSGFEANTI